MCKKLGLVRDVCNKSFIFLQGATHKITSHVQDKALDQRLTCSSQLLELGGYWCCPARLAPKERVTRGRLGFKKILDQNGIKSFLFQLYASANRPHAFTSDIRKGVRFCDAVINVKFGLPSCGKGESL